jgi:adenylate kinase family enzyme
MKVTIKLLENAMNAAMKGGNSGDGWGNGSGRFLIDGFPRKMDQAVKFDETASTLFHSQLAPDVKARFACLLLCCSSPQQRKSCSVAF